MANAQWVLFGRFSWRIRGMFYGTALTNYNFWIYFALWPFENNHYITFFYNVLVVLTMNVNIYKISRSYITYGKIKWGLFTIGVRWRMTGCVHPLSHLVYQTCPRSVVTVKLRSVLLWFGTWDKLKNIPLSFMYYLIILSLSYYINILKNYIYSYIILVLLN